MRRAQGQSVRESKENIQPHTGTREVLYERTSGQNKQIVMSFTRRGCRRPPTRPPTRPCSGEAEARPSCSAGQGAANQPGLTFGSMVVKGWGAIEASRSGRSGRVAALKSVDLPADGLPTRPTMNSQGLP